MDEMLGVLRENGWKTSRYVGVDMSLCRDGNRYGSDVVVGVCMYCNKNNEVTLHSRYLIT